MDDWLPHQVVTWFSCTTKPKGDANYTVTDCLEIDLVDTTDDHWDELEHAYEQFLRYKSKPASKYAKVLKHIVPLKRR